MWYENVFWLSLAFIIGILIGGSDPRSQSDGPVMAFTLAALILIVSGCWWLWFWVWPL